MTPEAVIAGAARWCVVEGDCLEVIPTLHLPAIHNVITDGPYGVGAYSETKDDGPYIEALRLLERVPSVAFFGYAETIIAWIIRLAWGPPHEWVTWYPSNAEAKANARSTQVLPRLAEHVAIYGETPGVCEVRRERSFAGVKSERPLTLDAQAGDVWTDPSPGIGFNSASRLHPNEKPVSVMAKLARLTSSPDAIVLDPFAGSGSTGVAALRNGRRAILVEREPRYAALARERMEAESVGITLKAQRAGQGALFGDRR